MLLDTSAWARLRSSEVSDLTRDDVAGRIRDRQIVVCLPFLLEAGFLARSAQDHDRILTRLLSLPFAPIDQATEHCVIEAQRELARSGQHRLPPVDLLIAGLAHRHGHGVLHHDRHYDLISERTFLTFESVWLR